MIKYWGRAVLVLFGGLVFGSGCENGFVDQNMQLSQALTAAGTTANTIPGVFSLIPSVATIVTGTQLQLTASAGNAPYQFVVLSKDPSGATVGMVDPNGVYHAPSSPGSAIVEAIDSRKQTAVATLIINGPLALTLATPQNPHPTQYVVTGNTAQIAVEGGVPPLSYSLSDASAGIGSLDSNGGSFTASAVGSATVTVTDSATPPNEVSESLGVYSALSLQYTTAADANPVVGRTFSLTVSGGMPPFDSFAICAGTNANCPAASASPSTLTPSSAPGGNGAGAYVFSSPGTGGNDEVCVTDSLGNSACRPITVYGNAAVSVQAIPSQATPCAGITPTSNEIVAGNAVTLTVNDNYASQTYAISVASATGGSVQISSGSTLTTTNGAGSSELQFAFTGSVTSFALHVQDQANASQSANVTLAVESPPSATPGAYPSAVRSGDKQTFLLSRGVPPYCAPTQSGTYAIARIPSGEESASSTYTFGSSDTTSALTIYDSLGNKVTVNPASSSDFLGISWIDATASSLTVNWFLPSGANANAFTASVAAVPAPSAVPTPSGSTYHGTWNPPGACTPSSCANSLCSCAFSNLPTGTLFDASLVESGNTFNLSQTTTAVTVPVSCPGILTAVAASTAGAVTLMWPTLTPSDPAGAVMGYAIYYGNSQGSIQTPLISLAAADPNLSSGSGIISYSYPPSGTASILASGTQYYFTVVPIVNSALLPASCLAGGKSTVFYGVATIP